MSLTLSALDEKRFMPVGQYLMRGEYDPNIVDEGTEWVRLETIIGVQEDISDEAIRSGIIYDTARTLELPGLQDLAFRKLKALGQNGPHRPFEILEVVDHVFKAAQPDMKKYLVEYVAEHFWNLVVVENRKFKSIMEADEELAKRVFSLLAGHPETEAKNEADGKMKVEVLFGKRKDELESPVTLVGDEAENSLLGEGNSQELLTLDYNGPIPHHREEFPLTGLTKSAKDLAAKEKAERDTVKKMTTKERLADADAFVDKAVSIISAANGPVSSIPALVHATLEATTAKMEKAETNRAARTTARELLANDDDNDTFAYNVSSTLLAADEDNDAFADNAASALLTKPSRKKSSTFDSYGHVDGAMPQEWLDLIEEVKKDHELEEAEKKMEKEMKVLQKKGDVGGGKGKEGKGGDLDGRVRIDWVRGGELNY